MIFDLPVYYTLICASLKGRTINGQVGLQTDRQISAVTDFPVFSYISQRSNCSPTHRSLSVLVRGGMGYLPHSPLSSRPFIWPQSNYELKTYVKGEWGNSGMKRWHSLLCLARGTCHILMWILSWMRCFPRVPPSLCLYPRLLFDSATVTSPSYSLPLRCSTFTRQKWVRFD